MENENIILNFIKLYGSMFIDLFQFVCTLLIIFYILFQSGMIHQKKKTKTISKIREAVNTLIILVLFGVLGIFASIKAFPIHMGVYANVRDLPGAIAGMLAGPVAGIGAGLIGGVYRFFLGGDTALPCSIAAVMSGVCGSIIYFIMKKRFIKPFFAALYAAGFEIFHLLLTLLLSTAPDPMTDFRIVIIPMTVANAFGLFMFSFMVNRALNYSTIKTKKDTIEAELKTAHEIQVSMLPRIFPPFPDRPEFDIFACMHPAKEVGGDFYDFFLINKNTLCFLIGDVSDKGVPAALFMAIIKTLLKNEALRNCPPNEVLARVNRILYPDNESCSFVTVFCAILDLTTGELEYSNGGHLPPVFILADGKPAVLPVDRNPIVGNMPNLTFTNQHYRLGRRDLLFLYTDGATDACNGGGKMLTDKVFRETVHRLYVPGKNIQATVTDVLDAIKQFAQGAEPYDDITLMALRFKG